MRLRSPLRQISPKTAQWRSWRVRQRIRLETDTSRSTSRGLCEGCGERARLEVHHVAGREEEPFSSLAELTAGLCAECHRAVTGVVGRGVNVGLRGKLASDALSRLNRSFGLKADSLNGALRQMKKTYRWDSAGCSITRI